MKPSKPEESADTVRDPQDKTSQAILSFADRLRRARTAQPELAKTFERWVVFKVSTRSLALPVSHVREVLRLGELTGVPNAPRPVAGIINVRGHVLPVLDAHELLGLPSQLATDSSRVLVLLLDSRPVGLSVDGVAGLEKLQVELIKTVADDEPLAELSRGTLQRSDKEVLLLLEPARLLAGENRALN